MNYASLLSALRLLWADTYDRAAPAGKTRFAVLSRYGSEPLQGDDRNLMDFPRCQLDVYTQSPDDPLPGEFCELLGGMCLPYQIMDEVWDDELALYRVIIQLEVFSR